MIRSDAWPSPYRTGSFAGSAAAQNVTLRASHQFPGGKGDPRDEMVQIIAREVKAANVGLEIQIYPGASLFKPNDQWNAMVNGQLDMSAFPLDYASGKVRAFGATLMPGLVRNHDRAQRINNSPFMADIKKKIEDAGVIVLADEVHCDFVAKGERYTPFASLDKELAMNSVTFQSANKSFSLAAMKCAWCFSGNAEHIAAAARKLVAAGSARISR